MKKLILSLALFAGALLLPARADKPADFKDYVIRVETCEAIIQEFMASPQTAIPAEVLGRAHAIVITNQLKAGVVLGIQDGYAVMLVRRPGGQWGLPVLLRTGEASLGLQLGVNTEERIYVIMDETVPRKLFTGRLNIGVDAKAVAGPSHADVQKDSAAYIDVPVLVYTKKKGLYAGATVKAGHLSRDDEANKVLYTTEFGLPELAYSDWVKPIPEVQPIMGMLNRIAPAAN